MRYTMFAALAALAFFIPGAQAQTSPLMTDWSVDDMRTVLTEDGVTVTSTGAESDGSPYVRGTADTGLKFSVYGAECSSKDGTERCLGAEFQTSFTVKPGMADKALADVDYAAIGYYIADGDLKLSRYVIFDNGIARENLKVNAKVFLNISKKVWDTLTKDQLLQ